MINKKHDLKNVWNTTCPKCGKTTPVDLSQAIDSDGETFECKHCNYPFVYANDRIK